MRETVMFAGTGRALLHGRCQRSAEPRFDFVFTATVNCSSLPCSWLTGIAVRAAHRNRHGRHVHGLRVGGGRRSQDSEGVLDAR